MSHAARNIPGSWRPTRNPVPEPVPVPSKSEVPAMFEVICRDCGTEFIPGSRYCHVCGGGRERISNLVRAGFKELFAFGRLRAALRLSAPSLVALIAGILCLVAAVATGFIFDANTALDWEAVQIWRLEWLLAAVALFVAGILLNKSR